MKADSISEDFGHHLVSAQQFSREGLIADFESAIKMRTHRQKHGRNSLRDTLSDRTIAMIFEEPSTRTHASFCFAADALGARIVYSSSNARVFSSRAKGESVSHMIETLGRYEPDFLVFRTHQKGLAAEAARILLKRGMPVRLFNAGDGDGEHPTQAGLDGLTIYRRNGTLDEHCVLLGGDLRHSRTVHSLIYLLAKFRKVRFIFVAPRWLQVPKEILSYLDAHDLVYAQTDDVRKFIGAAHAVYWTRLQLERIKNPLWRAYGRFEQRKRFQIVPSIVELMRKDAMLMHPLPINDAVQEIASSVDDHPQAAYLNLQLESGMDYRMALMANGRFIH